jgi:hypothetical protein
MVRGLEKFKKHFANNKHQYVLIGGTASNLVMEELGANFRATKDLDIVLCIEAMDTEFAKAIWEFVKEGGYENRQKSTGKRLFYRFQKPVNPEFPEMLELFSRLPDAIGVSEDSHLTPIPIGEDVSSLSAILLDDEYYSFIHENKGVMGDLPIVPAECLIPLKAKAFLDLSLRKSAGERVQSSDIKKHKNDIFRLFTILDPTKQCRVPEGIKTDLRQAFDWLLDEIIDIKQFGIKTRTLGEVVSELRKFYGLDT